MKILITGSSGLVGSALAPYLRDLGHHVVRLVRFTPRPGQSEILWDPTMDVLDLSSCGDFDAVVHLAGENLAEGRWTVQKKVRIRKSRIQGTRVLSEALARLQSPPKILASASAIGFYGHRADELLSESSLAGAGFLAEVCQQWEAATLPALERGIRVVQLRFGVVLSRSGGALAKMLPLFQLGIGGVLGSGRQYWSWIAMEDVLGAIDHILATDRLSGPVNVVSPQPITNREFTKTLGRLLSRPTMLPVPALAARIVFGEMADEAFLASARVEPVKLLGTGYTFRYPNLTDALRHFLKDEKSKASLHFE